MKKWRTFKRLSFLSRPRRATMIVKQCLFGVAITATFSVASTMASSAQTFTSLVSFDYTNGANPFELLEATDGNLYGTANKGGTGPNYNCNKSCGIVFRMTLADKLTTLHSFDGLDGNGPFGLVQASNGNMYGATSYGGAHNCTSYGSAGPCGAIYELTLGGTLTSLYDFCAKTSCGDGAIPSGRLVQASDGNLYGITVAGGTGTCTGAVGPGCGTVFRITPSGAFTLLHSFKNTDGAYPYEGLVLASNGNLYGTTSEGGAHGYGTVFEVTLGGKLTTLHSFNLTDGAYPYAGLIQGSNGNLYGTTTEILLNEGAPSCTATGVGYGTVFEITLTGAVTTLHTFASTDGAYPYSRLLQGTDGNFYATSACGGTNNDGTVFKMTSAGTVTTLHTFSGSDGTLPYSGLVQATKGNFYGTTVLGGTDNDGTVYRLAIGLPAFLQLQSTSGYVGSKIGILGQGFTSSSVVKFNGVKATTVTLTGTTYLVATVPVGASDGYVTVTNGTTILKSSRLFVVHNSWSSAAAIPTAVASPATGVIGSAIYVVGGRNGATIYDDNQVYDSSTNKWSTGAVLPATTYAAASAAANNTLYVIGGTTNGTNVIASVWAYNPKTNTWASEAAMPTARASAAATVENGIIYVIGGADVNFNRLTTVESYNPATNMWREEAPLMVGKSYPSVGLVGSTIVAADGVASSGDTGDTEGYDASTNVWSVLKNDPTGRDLACAGSVSGELYVTGGRIYGKGGAAESLTESFTLPPKDTWTTLASLPQATQSAGSVVYGGQLYCFGGMATQGGASIANVQIYQP